MSGTGVDPGDLPGPRPAEDDVRARLHRLLEDDPADLYENAPCGYLSALPDGTVVKVNRTFCAWTGRPPEQILGSRFHDLLDAGGRIFSETHLVPLLRMQGAVREIALDVVRVDGSLLPCLLNAVEVRDEGGAPVLVRATLFEATARRRYERELLAARRAAEESEARARSLHTVVSDLAAATTVDDVAAVIVGRSAEAIGARGAALVLVVEPGPPSSGAVPDLDVVRIQGLPAELLRELRVAAGDQLSLELAQGVRSIALSDRLRRERPGVAREMAAAGLTDLVLVPVSADTRRLGILVLGLGARDDGELISLDEPGTSRTLSAAETDLVWTLGRQAGQALERARLHEQTERQARRAAFLLDAARLLAAADDVHEMAERLAALVVPRLADLCVIDLAGAQGFSRAAARHGDPARQPLADALRTRSLPHRGAPHPASRALFEGRTQWVQVVDEELLVAAVADERHRDVLRALELESVVSVPFLADGRTLGVLTLGADRRRGRFTAADVEVAEQLALQVALVVEKAQRYEFEIRTSHTLQANLLPPPPPSVPGLDMAMRYLPATHGVEVGGDFYDVVQLPGEQVALAVGDVVGHDITAAATMGQLTSVHRALLADRPAPGAMVDRLQAGWSLLGLQRMATALFATLDPASGQLRMASAGHPAPLLVAGGTAEVVPVPASRMLGAPPAPSPAAEWAGVLSPGTTLLLFTDGLVESRTADLDAGTERLLAVAAAAGAVSPGELCDLVLTELTGPHRADDIALLALAREPAGA